MHSQTTIDPLINSPLSDNLSTPLPLSSLVNSSLASLPLARKYRPILFSQLIERDIITQTLRGSIINGPNTSAFLFHGCRGTGKTTLARIFARALNCQNLEESLGEPCNQCSSCLSILAEQNLDIQEIDAASYTTVENIKQITNSAAYVPYNGRYRVYIIDEVHMLSKSAFNALLKIFEEPPEYLKFILATTELRKIPDTVLSRCLKFNLPQVSIAGMKQHLAKISQIEGYSIDDKALNLLAISADGSVRDGLSLLDQMMLRANNKNISQNTVLEALGIISQTVYVQLLRHLLAGEITEAIKLWRKMNSEAYDVGTTIAELMNLVHILAAYKTNSPSNTYYEEEEIKSLLQLSQNVEVELFLRWWHILLEGANQLKFAPVLEHALEMLLIKLCYVRNLPNAQEKYYGINQPQVDSTITPAKLPGNVGGNVGGSIGTMGAPVTAPTRTDSLPKIAPKIPGAPSKDTATIPEAQPELKSEPAPISIEKSSPLPQEKNMEKDVFESFTNFADIAALCKNKGEVLLSHYLFHDAEVIEYWPGRIKMRLSSHVMPNLGPYLRQLLQKWTKKDWAIEVVTQETQAEKNANKSSKTLAQEREEKRQEELNTALQDPGIKVLLEQFPQAKINYTQET